MNHPSLRLGLCCKFVEQPIKFRTTTAANLSRHPRAEQLTRLAELARHNVQALYDSLVFCTANGIGSFRVGSSILPLRTHPDVGYDLSDLPGESAILAAFKKCGAFARKHAIRTGFHPDQFVVLNSPNPDIVARSVADIESQAQIAAWIGADTVNIHGGGGYGNKITALESFRRNLSLLSNRARSRLTVENDDKTYTPEDLLPLCRMEGVPLVYDVHHHRCLPDGLTIEEATDAARQTWGKREPLFHISSPIAGWKGPTPAQHHDYIDPKDFPKCWLGLPLTVEVEAKAKELAVLRLAQALARKSPAVRR